MNLSGTGNLTFWVTATLISAGLTFPGSITFELANQTHTLGDNWIVTGLVTSTASTQTINDNSITCNGGLTVSGTTQGTTTFIIGGTGGVVTITSYFTCALTFNCITATLASTWLYFGSNTMTYTAGTITTTGSTLRTRGNCTLNTNGMTWDNISFWTAGTITLSSDLNCSGILTINGGLTITFTGAFNISVGSLQLITMIDNPILSLVAGQTLTITTSLYLVGEPLVGTYFPKIQSKTTSATNLVFNGAIADCKVAFARFNYVAYSGAIVTGLDNWYGGATTNGSGITIRTSADIGGGAAMTDVVGSMG